VNGKGQMDILIRTDTVMSIGYGYIKLEMNRGEASPSIRFYEDLDPGVSGVTTSNFNRGALNVIYRKVPDDAQYLAGLESIEITREGFNDSVVINKEEIDTFLVGCK